MRASLRAGVDRWNAWRLRSVNHRIFAATLTVGSLAAAVKVAGALKLIVIARAFGTGDPLDAFLIAFLLPGFLAEVVGGSFHAALIPIFIEVHERDGRAAAQRLLSGVAAWNAALLVATAVMLGLTGRWILTLLGSGFDAGKLALARSLFYALLPVLILSGLSTVGRAMLNAGERFAVAALVPAATPLMTIALLLSPAAGLGPYALALGALAGSALELLVVLLALSRRGVSLIPRWRAGDPAVRRVMHQYGAAAAASVLMGGATVLNAPMAAMLGPGSVSALNYGGKLLTVVLAIISTALSTAILPHFSRMAALGDWRGLRHTLKTYSRLILLATLPLAVVLVWLSQPLVRALYQSGAFTEADTRLVAAVQRFFFLQMPFSLLGVLAVRLVSSLKANRLLVQAAVISLPLNVVLNYVLMNWLGVAGIALSSSAVSMTSLCYLGYKLLGLIRRAGASAG
ncbi:MAG: lipid II flippase MurJ [Acidobacteriota bacterium]